MDKITLTFTRDLEYLRLATALGYEICSKLISDRKITENFRRDLELVLSEAAANAIKHGGSKSGNSTATLTFEVGDDRLVIKVRDQGKGFSLEDTPLPDFDSVPEGGYGIYIMRTVMDDVQYECDPDGWNTLTLVKKYDLLKDTVTINSD